MQLLEIVKFLILRTIGNFLVLFALLGIALTFGQALSSEFIYRFNALRGVQFAIAGDSLKPLAQHSFFGEYSGSGHIASINPVDTDFGIVIPRINANARILPNVDPSNYTDYMGALRLGVAHAAGTALPGQAGNVYLFAHSTDYFWNVGRYNAVFYLLKELEVGDEVDIFFKNRRYAYIVSDKKIVSPNDSDYLTNSLIGQSRLTLQTCWPPGTTIKRLLVFAKPKGA